MEEVQYLDEELQSLVKDITEQFEDLKVKDKGKKITPQVRNDKVSRIISFERDEKCFQSLQLIFPIFEVMAQILTNSCLFDVCRSLTSQTEYRALRMFSQIFEVSPHFINCLNFWRISI
jgi:hypothetical protein